jgi:hypothetical protein
LAVDPPEMLGLSNKKVGRRKEGLYRVEEAGARATGGQSKMTVKYGV